MEGIVLVEAATHWNADLFVTDSPTLLADGGIFQRHVDTASEFDATQLLALLLRTRGDCILSQDVHDGGYGWLPPWWFYRVSACAALAEVCVWGGALTTAQSRSTSSNDWRSIGFFDDPIEGMIARFARALQARDRVLAAMLGLEGNESHDVVLYEVESLFLQLAGALDSAAGTIGLQFGPTGRSGKPLDPRAFKLHLGDFSVAVRSQVPSITDSDWTRWSTSSQLLGLVRNRIHGQPAVPVANVNPSDGGALWLVLPEADQSNFRDFAENLGGGTAWGAKDEAGPDSVLLDPWILTETAIRAVRDVLTEIADACLAGQVITRSGVSPWPWNKVAGDSTVRLLGLEDSFASGPG